MLTKKYGNLIEENRVNEEKVIDGIEQNPKAVLLHMNKVRNKIFETGPIKVGEKYENYPQEDMQDAN